MQNVLRLWFAATAVFIGAVMIWAFVPILVPAIAITFGMGALVVVIVWAARALERVRGGPKGPDA